MFTFNSNKYFKLSFLCLETALEQASSKLLCLSGRCAETALGSSAPLQLVCGET